MDNSIFVYLGILSTVVTAGFCCVVIAVRGIRDSIEDIYKDIATIRIKICKLEFKLDCQELKRLEGTND